MHASEKKTTFRNLHKHYLMVRGEYLWSPQFQWYLPNAFSISWIMRVQKLPTGCRWSHLKIIFTYRKLELSKNELFLGKKCVFFLRKCWNLYALEDAKQNYYFKRPYIKKNSPWNRKLGCFQSHVGKGSTLCLQNRKIVWWSIHLSSHEWHFIFHEALFSHRTKCLISRGILWSVSQCISQHIQHLI